MPLAWSLVAGLVEVGGGSGAVYSLCVPASVFIFINLETFQAGVFFE